MAIEVQGQPGIHEAVEEGVGVSSFLCDLERQSVLGVHRVPYVEVSLSRIELVSEQGPAVRRNPG